MSIFLATLFWLGALICVLNFYLSFLRYPIFLWRGGRKSEYKWTSGAPYIGSLFVLVGMSSLHETRWILIAGLVLILIDTGGLHWFLGSMLYQWITRTDEDVQRKIP